MKFCLKSICILLAFSSFCQSQIISNYGIKVGLVSSNLNETLKIDDPSVQKYFDKKKLSPAFGMFFHFFNIELLKIESELIYLQKGGRHEVDIRSIFRPDNSGKYSITQLYEFLQINLNICPKVEFHNFDIYGLIGISGNYLLSKSGVFSYLDNDDFVIGYNIGAGVTFNNLLNNKILFELVYNNDFNIFATDEYREIQNDNIQFRIGVLLSKWFDNYIK